jgi:hypothetical protein
MTKTAEQKVEDLLEGAVDTFQQLMEYTEKAVLNGSDQRGLGAICACTAFAKSVLAQNEKMFTEFPAQKKLIDSISDEILKLAKQPATH